MVEHNSKSPSSEFGPPSTRSSGGQKHSRTGFNTDGNWFNTWQASSSSRFVAATPEPVGEQEHKKLWVGLKFCKYSLQISNSPFRRAARHSGTSLGNLIRAAGGSSSNVSVALASQGAGLRPLDDSRASGHSDVDGRDYSAASQTQSLSLSLCLIPAFAIGPNLYLLPNSLMKHQFAAPSGGYRPPRQTQSSTTLRTGALTPQSPQQGAPGQLAPAPPPPSSSSGGLTMLTGGGVPTKAAHLPQPTAQTRCVRASASSWLGLGLGLEHRLRVAHAYGVRFRLRVRIWPFD